MINGEKAAYCTPTFAKKRERTLGLLLKDVEHKCCTEVCVCVCVCVGGGGGGGGGVALCVCECMYKEDVVTPVRTILQSWSESETVQTLL